MSEPTDEQEPADERAEASAPAKATDAEPKKKKRGRKAKEPPAELPLPGEGTPEGALLREANAAFHAGNYALVRERTASLRSASDPKVADAAADLARRVSVDPVQIGFLALCLVAISIIFYVYVLR